jgi:hypothetical protein
VCIHHVVQSGHASPKAAWCARAPNRILTPASLFPTCMHVHHKSAYGTARSTPLNISRRPFRVSVCVCVWAPLPLRSEISNHLFWKTCDRQHGACQPPRAPAPAPPLRRRGLEVLLYAAPLCSALLWRADRRPTPHLVVLGMTARPFRRYCPIHTSDTR